MLCQNTMNVLNDEQIFSRLVSEASVAERSSAPVEAFTPHWYKILRANHQGPWLVRLLL